MINRRYVIGAAVAALSIGSAALGETTLKVGDSAPAMKVAGWVKGSPVTKFQPGKVYVVEFWATWCGPCKTSIPHLTELAKKYKGKVSFTGVSVWERPKGQVNAYLPKIKEFVKDMGDKMAYNVAYDGSANTMAESWMTAANQNGIPSAFVIDQKGKVAWIGHPMAELEDVLDDVLAGTFDAQAAARKAEEIEKKNAAFQDQMKRANAEMQGVVELQRSGKVGEAIAKLDAVISKYPALRSRLLAFKFNLLSSTDSAAATKLAKELAEGDLKDEPVQLNMLAWMMVDPEGKYKDPDYDVAISIAMRAVELTKEKDAAILDTLALAHFKKGNKQKAIELQQKAVDLANKAGNQFDPQMKKEIEDRLLMFKKSQ